ncbi:helix-turn-helix transcriptional regulator [[Mycobacterium] holstebronense]|uniref:Helix-turn-helix domain-containing protein n=1 Tax=[Mycobacterium] holstebronense TaxID=3064288 RepID=A0ABM9LT08_9MYCO|nr:helix-turn-helix domain-containing protein [Mycolicibacter sp. MU0102]CAJ1504190.1 helix-turn-helix domain-containing protein [Mycolicibacter sp. MU0102]
MTSPTTLDPLMTPQQVADYRGTTVAVLGQERHKGIGPKFIRDGRRIRYRASDIKSWLDENTETPRTR